MQISSISLYDFPYYIQTNKLTYTSIYNLYFAFARCRMLPTRLVIYATPACWRRKSSSPMGRACIWAASSRYQRCWRTSKLPGIITQRIRGGKTTAASFTSYYFLEICCFFTFLFQIIIPTFCTPIFCYFFFYFLTATKSGTAPPSILRPLSAVWLSYRWMKRMAVAMIAIWAAPYCAAITSPSMHTGE